MTVSDRRPDSTYCYSVFTAAEASAMPRVLELFARRGLVPRRFDAAIAGADDGELVVDVQVCGLEPASAEQIARCLRQMVDVERVLMAVKGPRVAAAAGGVRR